ncbi:uncharacterized protein LOC105688058 isoform X2 [Athalia rosae]|uniref:uncharacterized protein LOC105688058 isoform X2 n=1 Tax=Athalia rosae TaxID=37344 RepID=UPI00203454DD|nr:uncharacterized protein LOC105688058 isoform X2 [Athalia rosae]
MLCYQPKTFLESINPLFYINFLMGMVTLPRRNRGCLLHSLAIFFTISVNFGNVVSTYIGSRDLIEAARDGMFVSSLNIAVNSFIVVILTNSFHTMIAPVLVGLQNKALTEYSHLILILDEKFKMIFGVEVQKEHRRRFVRLCFQIAGIKLITFCVGLVNGNMLLEDGISVSNSIIIKTMFQPISVIIILNLNFWTLLGYVGEKLRDLNVGLLRLTESTTCFYPRGNEQIDISSNVAALESPIWDVENLMNDKRYFLKEIRSVVCVASFTNVTYRYWGALVKCRKVHLELCKLSQEINNCFGVQNLLAAGTSFVIVTGLLYTIYAALAFPRSSIPNLTTFLVVVCLWIKIYSLRIWMITHICWSVNNEAERTGAIIYGFLKVNHDYQLRQEMKNFSLQVVQFSIRFNACGFIPLDHTLIQGVIASITTYLVILIQMSSIPSNISHLTSNSSANHTSV